ncbi:hypothetical protein TL16_g12855 [Triparma laevis f. inornata]|uniref:Uncharacterized protein n=1 Tax=Triparma laevis f. inornata TaxID=1714386 RepID=A0A9W7BXM3_9STRA|nr:hypothetical protein TL16_g12855 [Triparma laevis f. inornata]
MFGRKTKPTSITVSSSSMSLLTSLIKTSDMSSTSTHKRKISSTSWRVKNNGVDERDQIDKEKIKQGRKEGKRIKIMEEKVKRYNDMMSKVNYITSNTCDINNNDESNNDESLIDWSSKRSTPPTSLTTKTPEEYQKIIDEYGRTVQVEVGSTAWCTWAAKQGRESQINSIWSDNNTTYSDDNNATTGYSNRGYYGPPSTTSSASGSTYYENDKADKSDLNSNKAMTTTEKMHLKIVEEETKRAKKEKKKEGKGEDIRVYASAVVLPEEKNKDFKMGKGKKERMKELMELKKRKLEGKK